MDRFVIPDRPTYASALFPQYHSGVRGDLRSNWGCFGPPRTPPFLCDERHPIPLNRRTFETYGG